MRYGMLFSFAALNMIVCVDAMNAQDMLLRDFILFAAVAQPEVLQDNQPCNGYSQVPRKDKKFVTKNYAPMQRRKKDASNGKLCVLRSNKR
jgi:hypothetical protein